MHSSNLCTEFNWWDLKDNQYLYLEPSALQQLVKQGIEKAGSMSKLCIVLGTTHFYYTAKSGAISVKILRSLLNFIDREFTFINDKILEIRRGNRAALKNPKFPVDLVCAEMGSILGHMVSDGSLYYDLCRKDLIRTKYCSDDEQAINMFINSINRVFGGVHMSLEPQRGSNLVRIGNSFVGSVLRLAGAPIGRKCSLNEGIPNAVKNGGIGMQRAYLSAIFDDEGSAGVKPYPYVILSRNVHITLNEDCKNIVDEFVALEMKSNSFPTGHITKKITINALKTILRNHDAEELLNKILNSKPKLLVEESKLLDKFGIRNSTYVMSFQITSNGKYSIQTSLAIQNKLSVIKFYKEIGFCLNRKQLKLRDALINAGWINGN